MKAVILSGGRLERETVLEQIGVIKPDCIIAADKGLEFCYNEGIRPDHIVGDFDSLNPEIIEWYRCEGKIPIDTYRPEKDMTDTDIAMEKAVHLGADAIYLFGVTGTRLDHTLSNIFNLYKLHAQGIRGEIIDAQFAVWEPDMKEKAVQAVPENPEKKYDHAKIRELFLAGKKPKEIAAELNYPANTVAYHCHKVEREG